MPCQNFTFIRLYLESLLVQKPSITWRIRGLNKWMQKTIKTVIYNWFSCLYFVTEENLILFNKWSSLSWGASSWLVKMLPLFWVWSLSKNFYVYKQEQKMTDKLKEYPEKSYNTFTMKIIVMGTLPNDAKNVFFVG